jgi:uncharacterized protein involved in exopolysaccharide biosynthesis
VPLTGAVAGVVLGFGASLLVPPLWEGSASLVVRRSSSPMSLLSGAIPDGLAGSLLGKDAGGAMDTELALLRSRRLMLEVADSVPLGVRVRAPARTAALSIVARYQPTRAFAPVTIRGRREADTVVLDGWEAPIRAPLGRPVDTPAGPLTVAATAPDQFTLTLYDREEGVRRALKRLSVSRVGGELAGVTLRWDDSLTAAAVPNLLVARYLAWRLADDQGESSARLRFVLGQADSVRGQLDATLDSLRRFLESTSQVEPEVSGKLLLEGSVELDTRLRAVTLESEALGALLDRLARGDSAAARQLPAFPAFLRSPAINDLLSQLLALEGERETLLATRTASDPLVQSQTRTIRQLEAQLEPLARTYQQVLLADRRALGVTADSIRRVLGRLPGEGRRYYQLSRGVELMGKALVTLEVQALQLRVAAVENGGQARQVDIAEPTRKPARPSLALFAGGGGLLGILLGLGLVLIGAPPRGAERQG